MVLIGRARGAAPTGAFAILVQAVLFGWHHHSIPFWPPPSGVIILAPRPSPSMPAADDHDCQICFALGHHGAVPVDFFAPSPPDQARLHQPRLTAVAAPLARYFFCPSRAPPGA